MKIIDRYLVKHLVLPFLFCFASLFCIFVLIDLFDSIGDFAKLGTPLLDIIEIYTIMMGQVAPMIIPFAFFLSCVYLLTNLSSHKELVALMSAGVSLTRLVVPFMFVAFILSAIELYLYTNLAPTAAERRQQLMQQWSSKSNPTEIFKAVIYKNPATNIMWYIQELNIAEGTVNQAEITIPNDTGGDKSKYFIAKGNYRDGYWDFVGVRRINFINGSAEPAENLGQLNATFLTESPRQIAAVLIEPESMVWPELYRFITSPYQPSAARMAPYKTEHFRRIADPFLAPLLCLFAFALGIVHDRKNSAGAIFNCILILVTIFVVAKVSVAFGNKNRLSPQMAGWLPVLTYGLAGVALFIHRVGLWWEFTYTLKENKLWFGKEQFLALFGKKK